MIGIRAGRDVEDIAEKLFRAKMEIQTVRNSFENPVAAFGAYKKWITQQRRMLSLDLSEETFNSLFETPVFHSLSNSPHDILSYWLSEGIGVELMQREEALRQAIDELRQAIRDWRRSDTAMAVLDTNALLWHHSELRTFEWWRFLKSVQGDRLVLWVPLAVVDELDRLKKTNGAMRRGDKDFPVRKLARQALRTISTLFPDPVHPWVSYFGEDGLPDQLQIRLFTDFTEKVRGDVDGQIIDIAARLSTITRTKVMTYDLGMVFRAEALGVEAALMVEDIDDGPNLTSPIGAHPAS